MKGISKKVKKENIDCFLPYEEKIKHHSIILLEIFNFEAFDDLINGLNRLYIDADVVDSSVIKEIEVLLKSKDKLFKYWVHTLPLITNSRLEVKLPIGVYHDLGRYINEISIKVYGILPSMVILQIQIDLNFTFSDKINDVLYKFHDETINTIETQKLNYTSRISPKQHKKDEISDLRSSIKTEAIKFLSKYFKEGYFFKLNKSNDSIVPSIDLFSLTYPTEDKEIVEWEKYMNDFFECFSTFNIPDNSFKSGRYLLCRENSLKTAFSNYFIFANRKYPKCPEYSGFDRSIEDNIKDSSFELLAISRFIDVQKRLIGKFNKMISKEMKYLQKEELDKAIENRKVLTSELFYFERFKIEFKEYQKIELMNKINFLSLTEKVFFFDNLVKNMDSKIDEIDNSIKTFGKYSSSFLKLNNIDYTKKNQDKVYLLTIVVAILTVIQVLIAFKVPELIFTIVIAIVTIIGFIILKFQN